MEGIHGVDVSWLHSSNREHHHRIRAPTSPGLAKDAPPKTSSNGGLPVQPPGTPSDKNSMTVSGGDALTEISPQPPSSTPSKTFSKRPGMLGRSTSEKSTASTSSQDSTSSKGSSRRGSWISNLSSKFGGSQGGQGGSPGQNSLSKAMQNGSNSSLLSNGSGGSNQQLPPVKEAAGLKNMPAEDVEPYVPSAPKASSSFFSNAFRRLSSSSATSTSGKAVPNGGMCPRRVMNVDTNRERCAMPELDQNKLRKVSFCVDVEIAGGPRYKDEEDADGQKKKNKDKKLKEKGEGAALRNPQFAADEKDKGDLVSGEDVGNPRAQNPEDTVKDEDEKDLEKKDKKKLTDEEKRERADKKRKRAEENGSVPKEYSRDDGSSPNSSSPATPRPQDKPTTDPLRIYRRCCQLRETPILKRITEQLARAETCSVSAPGIVTALNLTGSRLQLPDVVALSDWLAVVPVKKLLLEDADLTDEGIRVILAGLLAAKPPDEQRSSPRHQKAATPTFPQDSESLHHERLGIVEKLSLKNNPRLTAEAWKHISLFIYMCRSIKALDVSMNEFPKPPPQVDTPTPNSVSTLSLSRTGSSPSDPGEIYAKALSSRLGGNHLEELMMAECDLSGPSIRKIVDAVMMSGVSRLGLAGNNLDAEGLGAVVHYMRSGICQGIDLAGNKLRDSLGKLAEGFSKDSPLWALSLADNNLTPAALKPLFPALMGLPNLRFIDFSHNQDLFRNTPDALPLFRKYLPQLERIKRVHLCDVALEPRQAIGLAEVLPESPNLAHLNILENPSLQRLASATAEADQEEACALYASLMAAARVSDSIICIDVDVPTQDNSEIVKALGKQVVAYCLRNMERFAGEEAPEAADAVAAVSEMQNAINMNKEIDVPEVLLHLIGHVEGNHENHDNDEPAPDDDYIVGGTGVVKALQYCLSEKAEELRRESAPSSGAATPSRRIAAVEGGAGVKAKKLSKNLLESARKIRIRLHPALIREAKAGDDMAYRRLQFLDDTLKNIIDRFEAEYPDTRVSHQEAMGGSPASTPSSSPPPSLLSSSGPTPSSLKDTDSFTNSNAVDDSDEEEPPQRPGRHSRKSSDVSLASRKMGYEEGRMHKLGHAIRQDILRPSAPESEASGANSPFPAENTAKPHAPEPAEIAELKRKLENLQGTELMQEVRQRGWEEVMRQIGSNIEELKALRYAGEMGELGEEEERDWQNFREAQEKAYRNSLRAKEEGEETRKGKTDSAILE